MERIAELLAPRDLFSIEVTARLTDAMSMLQSTHVSHLMVTSDGSLVGVVCACDVDSAAPDLAVGQVIGRDLVTIEADDDVTAAAARMRDNGVSCLPVLDHGALFGVVTWKDLSRLGVVPPYEERCIACGSTEHVRCVAHGDLAGFCLECMRRSGPPDLMDELGEGD